MRTDTPKTIYLKDYAPYPFILEDFNMSFDIHDGYTIVTARSHFIKKKNTEENTNSSSSADANILQLYGENLELTQLLLDDEDVQDFDQSEKDLTINNIEKDNFVLSITTKIKPEENTRLEGLYKSGDTYCTQCEPEGFRSITYFPDRPDVLTKFTVRIEADKKNYPVLLSNGNRMEQGDADDGRHYAVWHDPFLKPCYLFALVAGDLSHIKDEFITMSGRKVDLYIYVRPGDEGQCDHAMESLKKSMKWDEETYGLEYDLDLFNIVAVNDFNMGAMENKSLNIFNTALVLAHQDTATDTDFMRVESVIAHEYFHNWSGNRVTCRDWFQLSLKEGLTVFRDQEFSSDLHSRAVQRIDDVSHLRDLQFPEDASPLAHPIRPDNYIEINNFYTMTIYEKGAEVIRMMRTILGPENYRKGTDLYFEKHDGQAVTCDDFVQAMQDASGIDLSHFKLWYKQAGTPELSFSSKWIEDNQSYEVSLEQNIPDTPQLKDQKPLHIPVVLGLLNSDGKQIYEDVLHLKDSKQVFTIAGIENKPIPSVLRGFSAPIRLKSDISDEELAFLMAYDNDGFNFWEAGQNYALRVLQRAIEGDPSSEEEYLSSFEALLQKAQAQNSDKALLARALTLPSISRIALEIGKDVDPEIIYSARQKLLALLKRTFKSELLSLYKDNTQKGSFSITSEAMGQRALRNVLLYILTSTSGTGCAKLAKEHYDSANCMTDRVSALSRLSDNNGDERLQCFDDFYDRFKDYPLVVNKWFSLQACSQRKEAIEDIKTLQNHGDFTLKNPNRVRSLYGAFAISNPVKFHAKDGSGYDFLTDAVIALNDINPQIAARLLTPMRDWKIYSSDRQDKIKACLEKILQTKNISNDVFEIANKTLNA